MDFLDQSLHRERHFQIVFAHQCHGGIIDLGGRLFFCGITFLTFCSDTGYFLGNGIPAFFRQIRREDALRYTKNWNIIAAERYLDGLEQKNKTGNDEPAKIFMVMTQKTYYLSRQVFADNLCNNIALLKSLSDRGLDPIRWLAENNYRYLLFDAGRVDWYREGRSQPAVLRPEDTSFKILDSYVNYFQQQILNRLEPKKRFNQLILYEVPVFDTELKHGLG